MALGFLHGRLHVLCIAEEPDGIRVISARKANSREVSRHANVQALDDQHAKVRELSMTEVKQMRPASAVLPALLQAKLRARGSQNSPAKERITIRLGEGSRT